MIADDACMLGHPDDIAAVYPLADNKANLKKIGGSISEVRATFGLPNEEGCNPRVY
jgi:hypothetical protein